MSACRQASVAQWIERLRPKEGVGSSILSGGIHPFLLTVPGAFVAALDRMGYTIERIFVYFPSVLATVGFGLGEFAVGS